MNALKGIRHLGGAIALIAAGTANAGIVSITTNTTDPFGAEANFLAALDPLSIVTEDFEGFTITTNGSGNSDTTATTFTTAVGDFSATGAAGTGACSDVGTGSCDELAILSDATSPYNGRYDVTDGDGDTGGPGQWLDSNDVSQVTWDISTSGSPMADAFGFYITDPGDQRATLSVTFSDGSTSQPIFIVGGQGSGSLTYVSAASDAVISSATVVFENVFGNTTGDGFGIDNVTIGRVPNPAVVSLFGIALAAFGIAAGRRRRQQAA